VENILDSEGQEKALELQKLVGLGRDYLYHLGKRNLEFFNGQGMGSWFRLRQGMAEDPL
jgi:hypothetical protein